MTDSIRSLIAELAIIEDAIRRVSLTSTNGETGAGAGNDELVMLSAREAEIVALLRAQHAGTESQPAVG